MKKLTLCVSKRLTQTIPPTKPLMISQHYLVIETGLMSHLIAGGLCE